MKSKIEFPAGQDINRIHAPMNMPMVGIGMKSKHHLIFRKQCAYFINDGVDTARDDNEFTPLRNWFNEFYARETSKKIRAVKQAKAQKGERVNGECPYGYTCGNYRNRPRKMTQCSAHYIRKSVITELVLADMQRVLSFVKRHEKEFIKTATELGSQEALKTAAQEQKKLSTAQTRLKEIDTVFRKLYEDNALGKLSDEQFVFMTSGYEEEKKTLKERIAVLDRQIQAAKEHNSGKLVMLKG